MNTSKLLIFEIFLVICIIHLASPHLLEFFGFGRTRNRSRNDPGNTNYFSNGPRNRNNNFNSRRNRNNNFAFRYGNFFNNNRFGNGNSNAGWNNIQRARQRFNSGMNFFGFIRPFYSNNNNNNYNYGYGNYGLNYDINYGLNFDDVTNDSNIYGTENIPSYNYYG